MDDISREVRRYLRYLRRYWWLLVAGALLGALAVVVVDSRSSSAGNELELQQFVVLSERWTGMSSSPVPGTLFGEDPDALAVALARVTGDAAMEELGELVDIQAEQITVALDGRRVLLDIRAAAEDATTAAEWFVAEVDESRVRDTLAPIELATSAVEARLAALAPEVTTTDEAQATSANTEAASLETELEMLQSATDAVPTELQSDIVRHRVTGAPAEVGGFRPMVLLIGAGTGVVLAGVAIVIWSVLDRRVSTRRDVEAVIGEGSLLAVVGAAPSETDLKAAAAAVDHLRPAHPSLSLVDMGQHASDVVTSIATLSATPHVRVDEALSSTTPATWVPVARSGKVTDTDLERLQFVVERAGGEIGGVILVGGKTGADLLD